MTQDVRRVVAAARRHGAQRAALCMRSAAVRTPPPPPPPNPRVEAAVHPADGARRRLDDAGAPRRQRRLLESRSCLARCAQALLALAALLAGASAFAQSATIASTSPATLNQSNLRTAWVAVNLTSATYQATAAASHFTLNTTIPGLTVRSLWFNSGRDGAILYFHWDGSDFNTAATIGVTVAAAATTHSSALTTNNTAAVGVAHWVNVSAETVALTEGGGAGSYTVVLESQPTGDVSVAVASDNAAVTVDSDSTPLTRTLTFSTTTWNSPQTVTVTPADDNADAVDELALVTNVATGGGYASSAAANRTVRVTVADDERTGTDYDADNDQLIEISGLAQLNAMRWDVDGNGAVAAGNAAAYAAAFPGAATGMGCPDGGDGDQLSDGCRGYELTADLDFDTNGDGAVDASDAYPNWAPIGGEYNATFHGNNRTIANLATRGGGERGLFWGLGSGSVVSNLGLVDFAVSSTSGPSGPRAGVGALAGFTDGTVEAVYVRGGAVSASYSGGARGALVGGLVGAHNLGVIRACYATAAVSGRSNLSPAVGGLVGSTQAEIVASYAAGAVHVHALSGTGEVGGLVGEASTRFSVFTNSYARGAVSATGSAIQGGLIGRAYNYVSAPASYWDSQTTGQSSSARGTTQTTNGLQTPTAYGSGGTDIYAYWDDHDTDGDGRIDAADDAWDFGASDQYPSLKYGGLDPTRQFAVRPATVDPGPPSVTPVNRAPYVRRGIDDLDIDPGELARVPLVGVFGDEAPGRLRHAAESSNPSAASARAVGGVVLVEGLAPGLATVTVTAEDEGGLSARTSFSASVGRVLSFADAEASAPEGGMLRLRLRLSRTSEASAAFAWRAVADGDPLTADADAGDLAALSGSGAVAGGETEALIEVAVSDDGEIEPAREFLRVELLPPASGADWAPGVASMRAVVQEGVCDRSAEVRDALRGARECWAPSVRDLAGRGYLDLRGRGIAALRERDLLGLSGLRVLHLHRNRLAELPEGLFAGLGSLERLRLDGNRLAALPAGLFGDSSRLSSLDLSGNRLRSLPAGLWEDMALLSRLDLSDNRLDSLPAGFFAGLSGLSELNLLDNPGAPFTLTMELARTDAEPWAPGPATVAARVREGAPFALSAGLAVRGSAELSTETARIGAGEVSGAPIMVALTAGGAARLSPAGAPEAPAGLCGDVQDGRHPCFQGIRTAAGPGLLLFKRPPRLVRAVPDLEAESLGGAASLDLAEFFEADGGEELTWAAESSDASLASARVEGGVLRVLPNGEGLEGLVTVTITATDADGLSAEASFVVEVLPEARPFSRGWRLLWLTGASAPAADASGELPPGAEPQ